MKELKNLENVGFNFVFSVYEKSEPIRDENNKIAEVKMTGYVQEHGRNPNIDCMTETDLLASIPGLIFHDYSDHTIVEGTHPRKVLRLNTPVAIAGDKKILMPQDCKYKWASVVAETAADKFSVDIKRFYSSDVYDPMTFKDELMTALSRMMLNSVEEYEFTSLAGKKLIVVMEDIE